MRQRGAEELAWRSWCSANNEQIPTLSKKPHPHEHMWPQTTWRREKVQMHGCKELWCDLFRNGGKLA